jgi:hypothetical protein
MMNYLLKPFKNLGRTLKPQFASEFTQQVKDLVVHRLVKMTESDFKLISKELVE